MLRSKRIFLSQLVLTVCMMSAGISTGTAESILPDRIEYYEVISVKVDDTLNLRVSANDKSRIIFKLPHNASGLLKLGATGNWLKLSYKNHIGWAYNRYLKKTAAPGVVSVTGNEELYCYGTEPHWMLKTHSYHLTYGMYDEEDVYVFDSLVERQLPEKDGWLLTAVHTGKDGRFLQAVVKQDRQCSDDMSNSRFNYSISVSDRAFGKLSGCCNRR